MGLCEEVFGRWAVKIWFVFEGLGICNGKKEKLCAV